MIVWGCTAVGCLGAGGGVWLSRKFTERVTCLLIRVLPLARYVGGASDWRLAWTRLDTNALPFTAPHWYDVAPAASVIATSRIMRCLK